MQAQTLTVGQYARALNLHPRDARAALERFGDGGDPLVYEFGRLGKGSESILRVSRFHYTLPDPVDQGYTATSNPDIFRLDQVVELLGISASTFRKYRQLCTDPALRGTASGKVIMYAATEIIELLGGQPGTWAATYPAPVYTDDEPEPPAKVDPFWDIAGRGVGAITVAEWRRIIRFELAEALEEFTRPKGDSRA